MKKKILAVDSEVRIRFVVKLALIVGLLGVMVFVGGCGTVYQRAATEMFKQGGGAM